MDNFDLKKLYSLFDSIKDLKLKKDLYFATGNFTKASELEQELFFDELKINKIKTLEDYICALNKSALIGISSNSLLEKFSEFKNQEIRIHQGTWGHIDDSWVVACNYYDLAVFHEARFGVHYEESDLKKSFEFRQKILDLDIDLVLVKKYSPSKSTRGARIKSADCIDAILNFTTAFNTILKQKECAEELIEQNVEIFNYLNCQDFDNEQIKEAINAKRIEFLGVLSGHALKNANKSYEKKEKEDKNGYIAWCFKCACAYTQRAIDFSQRLSQINDDKVEAIKKDLNECFTKLNEVYKQRKYSEDNFDVWIKKQINEQNPTPNHKSTGWYIKEDDLMWPKRITLTSRF